MRTAEERGGATIGVEIGEHLIANVLEDKGFKAVTNPIPGSDFD
jgi:hypothetical protein